MSDDDMRDEIQGAGRLRPVDRPMDDTVSTSVERNRERAAYQAAMDLIDALRRAIEHGVVGVAFSAQFSTLVDGLDMELQVYFGRGDDADRLMEAFRFNLREVFDVQSERRHSARMGREWLFNETVAQLIRGLDLPLSTFAAEVSAVASELAANDDADDEDPLADPPHDDESDS